MAGVPVKGLIDTGSGATIISFEMFKKIGKTANIPSSSLYPVDLILRDYNRNPISLGARIDMEISWREKSMTVPVHIRSASDPDGEPCLLGNNVAIPSGLGWLFGPSQTVSGAHCCPGLVESLELA